MLILSIRTDKPQAEIGLYDAGSVLDSKNWEADRRLAETIHERIALLLADNNKSYHDINGIICYGGQGSFTGLRIGMSVANALAYGLSIPIVAASEEKLWPGAVLSRINSGANDKIGQINYGSQPFVSLPKK